MRDLDAVFERSPELLQQLRSRVSADETPEDVVAKARVIIDALPESERIAVLNAHPRIGADVQTLSAASRREQGEAANAAVSEDLMRLQHRYETVFGFRFVVFVNGRSRAELIPILRERLTRAREAELRTGIDEFLAISLDRLRRSEARA